MTEHGDAGEAVRWVYRPEAELAAELLVPQAQCPVEAAHPHGLHGFTPRGRLLSAHPRCPLEEWLQSIEVLCSVEEGHTHHHSKEREEAMTYKTCNHLTCMAIAIRSSPKKSSVSEKSSMCLPSSR